MICYYHNYLRCCLTYELLWVASGLGGARPDGWLKTHEWAGRR